MNKAPYAIEVQENNRPGDRWVEVQENDCIPFWPKSDANMLRVKAKDDSNVSRPFKCTDVQCTLLKIKNKVNDNEK